MYTTLRLVGVPGGSLAVISGVAALIVGGGDTVIVGGWMTVAAGVIAIIGTALAPGRPRLAALLMTVGVVVAGLVAPGVIPALADTVLVFMAYLGGLALLLAGAILAFMERKATPTRTLTGFSH